MKVGYFAVGLLFAFLLGAMLPHPLGLVLVGTAAFGGLMSLSDRVARLEGRVGVMGSESPADETGYQVEQVRVRRQMARYAAAKEAQTEKVQEEEGR